MDPWYKVVTPRKEVREGRSFNPDEFAIALEQVVASTAPADYKDPEKFFSRTYFTRALKDHAGMVLRRLAGKTENSAPVLTLITQFGGGKTHTLTALYHLARNARAANNYAGVSDVLKEAGLAEVPQAKVAVFVGNAWDPKEGRENPWIDIARQLAGDKGVELLGTAAKTSPPGTETIGKIFQAAGGPVLILFDEVLNFLNRHRNMADSFYAFFDNINRATTGTTHCAAVMSLPRSQMEMTEWDSQWQDKITKVVRRVAKDLIANDETEISEVIRRRLFEDLGSERIRKNVAKAYADWCFERRERLPAEWTAVDTAATEAKARDFLRSRFEACYPFHPATLSVFQRKWQPLGQYQQTRGTLAMFAQWISWVFRKDHEQARREPVLTLGSAPLEVPQFQAIILGQLGEPKLEAAIGADISGDHSHAKALDADTKGPLRDIHRRVATTILFESSGGQVDKVAHLPEIRFALGEPEIDTTSIDNAAHALEAKAFFISRIGSDGFKIYYKATIRKAVSDRRASLDDAEVRQVMRSLVKQEFDKGANISLIPFPEDGTAVQDSPKLTLVIMDPESEWNGSGQVRERIAEWTKQRGKSPRLYPGSLVWCLKKPGRDLRDKVELSLAWKRVAMEVADGTLGNDYDPADRAEIHGRVREAEGAAKDEVWAGYRFVVLSDNRESDGLKVIDLGAGHASGAETLCGRVLDALRSQALLNVSVGAGYIDRNWPPALKESGAWALASLRQSFLNGALTRLPDPDAVLRTKVPDFVLNGDFGLASGQRSDGTYDRLWFAEPMTPDEVTFEANVFLLTKGKAIALKGEAKPEIIRDEGKDIIADVESREIKETERELAAGAITLRLVGSVPPEVWNRIGTKLIPKLRSGQEVNLELELSVTLDGTSAQNFEYEIRQILEDLGLTGRIRIEKSK